MYKLCKTEQSAARQRQLEQGLLAAISVRRYEDLSVSDLCDQLVICNRRVVKVLIGENERLAVVRLEAEISVNKRIVSLALKQQLARQHTSQIYRYAAVMWHQKDIVKLKQGIAYIDRLFFVNVKSGVKIPVFQMLCHCRLIYYLASRGIYEQRALFYHRQKAIADKMARVAVVGSVERDYITA